jgi:hypothetical protein
MDMRNAVTMQQRERANAVRRKWPVLSDARWICNYVTGLLAEGFEQTEAHFEAWTVEKGMSLETYEEVIGELLDSGAVSATVIQHDEPGRRRRFYPALRMAS